MTSETLKVPKGHSCGGDFYIEPGIGQDTLANLGPLRPLAGIWEGLQGVDEHPVLAGTNPTPTLSYTSSSLSTRR